VVKIWAGKGIFLFSKMLRPALKLSQPPTLWYRDYFAGVKQLAFEFNSVQFNLFDIS
jgi:hypothetical protein